ncbi:right-handed parallel beta-helix repeat-containing protein [Candidatus Micrarchaeota archaeon]|nr:right-handed parallel beta-helix repeat-containing protein [Candidatus Micrarchaeota archaeon]
MDKKILILFILFVSTNVTAGFCGGTTPCNCGDVIMNSTVLTKSLTCNGTALTIGNNNLELNCNSNILGTFTHGNGIGIKIDQKSNVTITNCLFESQGNAIYLINSTSIELTKNAITKNDFAINIQTSNQIIITQNTITDGQISNHSNQGIYIVATNNTIIEGNYLENVSIGINLVETITQAINTNSSIKNNKIINTAMGIGGTIKNSLIEDNTLFDLKYSGIYLKGENIVIKNNSIKKINYDGITLTDTKNASLTENKIISCEKGITALAINEKLTANKNILCYNKIDINNETSGAIGVNNTCNTPNNWNDETTKGCTFQCKINRPPIILYTNPNNNPNITLLIDRNYTFSITADDPDGDELYYDWFFDDKPVDSNGPKYSFTYSKDLAGRHQISVIVSDSIDSKNVTWKIAVQKNKVIWDFPRRP